MFQSDNKQNSLGTILAPEINIKGDINVSGNIIVYGTVHGNIISTGTVNTAKGSTIDGNIKAQSNFISGEVNGDVDVDKKVVLGPSCKLIGNIKASIITMEEGANFDGMCNMLQAKEPQVEKINTSSQ
ncbi:MAG: polymer-forming cytoskeletal protein [Candidatus Thalassarchaeum sp.]|nr:polymer-forming cytoskeletal protein [Candidatus Thalassarchaeum sp.]